MDSPIEYPRVTIGGKSYELRFTYGAVRRARALGALYNEEQVKKLTFEERVDVDLKLIAACAGNVTGPDQWEPIALSWLQIQETISPGEYDNAVAALSECLRKAAQAGNPATLPAQTQPETASPSIN